MKKNVITILTVAILVLGLGFTGLAIWLMSKPAPEVHDVIVEEPVVRESENVILPTDEQETFELPSQVLMDSEVDPMTVATPNTDEASYKSLNNTSLPFENETLSEYIDVICSKYSLIVTDANARDYDGDYQGTVYFSDDAYFLDFTISEDYSDAILYYNGEMLERLE